MLSPWVLVAFLISITSASDCDFLTRGTISIVEETTVNVDLNSKQILYSKGFPDSVEMGRWRLASPQGNTVNWKMIFTDLDISGGSKFCIQGVKKDSSGNEVETTLYSIFNVEEDINPERGRLVVTDAKSNQLDHVIRPVIAFTGVAIIISFQSQFDGKPHTGFRAEYWIDPDEVWHDGQPVTDCPYLIDPMAGGHLKITKPTLISDDEARGLYFDCRWQIRSPNSETLENYIRITALSLHSSGHLKIYQQVSSPGPMTPDDQQNVAFHDNGINKEVFLRSRKGFYIELKKPMIEGEVEFVYGVGQPLLEDEECEISLGKNLVPGFRCNNEPKSWCILQEGVCDKVRNCPNSEDEENCKGVSEEILKFNPNTDDEKLQSEFIPKYCTKEMMCQDGACRKHSWLCPEQGCYYSNMHRCADSLYCVEEESICPENQQCPEDTVLCDNGLCVSRYHGICPNFDETKPCGDSHKVCQDGSCVSLTERCVEDPCPRWRSHRCDEGKTCYEASESCDRHYACRDQGDERFCDEDRTVWSNPSKIHWWIWLIVAAAVFFTLISVGSCLISWRKTSPAATVCEPQGYSGIPMQSASEEQEQPSSEKEDYVAGNVTLGGTDAYETLNAGKTYGSGYQEGCMQFY